MSDYLYQFHVNSKYYYNHGRHPWKAEDDLSAFSGSNQLFGDGRVVWKSVRTFDRVAIERLDPTAGYVPAATPARAPSIEGKI